MSEKRGVASQIAIVAGAITVTVAAIGASGKAIVTGAQYLGLPERMTAIEKRIGGLEQGLGKVLAILEKDGKRVP